jgi:hypothetical protein
VPALDASIVLGGLLSYHARNGVPLLRRFTFLVFSPGITLLMYFHQFLRRGLGCLCLSLVVAASRGEELSADLESALQNAQDNRTEIQAALDGVPDGEREGMEFLILNMPNRDLNSLSAEFLLENVRHAYRAWNESPWKEAVPKHVFLNDVLPYASVTERRDQWRKDFFERFMPLVKEASAPGEAAAVLNQKIFPLLKVKYSTKRQRADQSPLQSIDTGLASCTGLSVLLIDACRAVGVPARFAGTPLWSDRSGNHSWVEVWDDGWHFTGAAEPTGIELDRAWFIGRASNAQRDHRLHAIYAVSFKKTPLKFPMVWARGADYVYAVNVTDRYVERAAPLPEGHVRILFRVVQRPGGERSAASIRVKDDQGKTVFEGTSKDERFDANDHLTAVLPEHKHFDVQVRQAETTVEQSFDTHTPGATITVPLNQDKQ